MSLNLPRPFSEKLTAGTPAFDIGQMPEMKNALFKDKDLTLDGWRLISCRIENCRIHVSSLYFVLQECAIDADCVIYYQGETIKLIQLWNARNEWMQKNFPGFAPQRHYNGTISIGV